MASADIESLFDGDVVVNSEETTAATEPEPVAEAATPAVRQPKRPRRAYANRGESLPHGDFLSAKRSLKSVQRKLSEALRQYDGVTTLLSDPRQMQPHHQEQLRTSVLDLNKQYSFLPPFSDRTPAIVSSSSPVLPAEHATDTDTERSSSSTAAEHDPVGQTPTDNTVDSERSPEHAESSGSPASPASVAPSSQPKESTAILPEAADNDGGSSEPIRKSDVDAVIPAEATLPTATKQRTVSFAPFNPPFIAAGSSMEHNKYVPEAVQNQTPKHGIALSGSSGRQPIAKRPHEPDETAHVPMRTPLVHAKVTRVYNKLRMISQL